MSILYPVFAMAALTFFCMARMGYLRYSAIRRGEVDWRFFRLYKDYEEPDYLRALSRHVVNLHEAPVLFYVVVILAHATDSISPLLIGLAWSYVALRYAHSYVHLTSNTVPHRFRLFVTSQFVLIALWLLVLVYLLR